MAELKRERTPEQHAAWVKQVADAIDTTVFHAYAVDKVGDALAIMAYLAGWTLVEVEDEARSGIMRQFFLAVTEQAERAAAKIKQELPDGVVPTKH